MNESINIVDAYIRDSIEGVYLQLGDNSTLNIPPHHQECLSNYINEKVKFGIRPDFIYLADDNDKLNTVEGQFTELQKQDNGYNLIFNIEHKLFVSKVRNKVLNTNDIGKYFNVNFDTYFSHIFDHDTKMNLTI